jgi:hypothetical protein
MALLRRAALGRALVRKKALTPIGALGRGLCAGMAGALAQDLFFRATARLAPRRAPVPPELGKPDREARDESNLETAARRLYVGMMKRGPLDAAAKRRLASGLHYAFGAAWGGVYALLRESLPALPATLFGVGVWAVSDGLLLPAFRLAAWPRRYSLREHHYALHAHLVYGLATAGTYAALRGLAAVPLAALPALIALQARSWLSRLPPGRLVLGRRERKPQLAAQWIDRVAHA